MAKFECSVCGYEFDEDSEGMKWEDLPDDWECPICGAGKSEFAAVEAKQAPAEPQLAEKSPSDYLQQWQKASHDLEVYMADIHRMAESGESILEPMLYQRTCHLLERYTVQGGATG